MTIILAIIIGFTVIVLGMMFMAMVTAAWPLFLTLAFIYLLYVMGKARRESYHQCCCGD